MPQGFLPWGYDMNHPYHKYKRRYISAPFLDVVGESTFYSSTI